MPAFPERNTPRLDEWRAPNPYPSVVKGALIGAAIGTVMWVVAVAAAHIAYRWLVG